tara:strand:+ start:42982 stop:43239 length:258 start_codon:yes stop_codon:yes gene_type:complete
MGNKDGWSKNLEVYKWQLEDFRDEMLDIWRRLKKPSLNPKNREHFVLHVLAGILPATLESLNRVLGLVGNVALIVWAAYGLWGLM